jgi:hypothetical protein
MVPVIIIAIFQDVFLVRLEAQPVFSVLREEVGIQPPKLAKFMPLFLIAGTIIEQRVLLVNQDTVLILQKLNAIKFVKIQLALTVQE